ncbi:MAG: energy transducer TonB, partial [Pseudomonas sp.]
VELAPLPAAAPQPAPAPPPVKPAEPELPQLAAAPKPKLAVAPKPKLKAQPPKPVEPPQPQAKPLATPQPQAPANPAPQAKAPSAAQPSAARTPSKAEQSWQSKLLSHLSRYKRYPEDARRRGFEGTSRVRFRLDGRGKVLAVSLAGSSGSAALDRATLAMLRRAQPLPPPPPELLADGSLEIVAPFVYSLDKR